ncbi:MAG: beta-lactamase family protein, partial [Actinomycetia bacterium]|nr:beta-lactamase family protein [Actinomycetes bacterium]
MTTTDTLRRLLLRARADETFSVGAYEIGRSTGPLHSDVVGTLSWDGPTAKPGTPFDIASVTKPIVAVLAAAMLERGVLALDDTVERLLPQYARTDKARITVGELLTHTSGLPGQVRMYRWAHTPEQMWDGLARLPLVAPPGVQVAYSSQGFILLGAILEAAATAPLDEAVRTYVLSPNAMHSTRFGLPTQDHARAAATEECPWRG